MKIKRKQTNFITDRSTGGVFRRNCNKSCISFTKSMRGMSKLGLPLRGESITSGDMGCDEGLKGLYDLYNKLSMYTVRISKRNTKLGYHRFTHLVNKTFSLYKFYLKYKYQ